MKAAKRETLRKRQGARYRRESLSRVSLQLKTDSTLYALP